MTSKQSYNSRHKAFILINLLFLNAAFGSKWVLKKINPEYMLTPKYHFI